MDAREQERVVLARVGEDIKTSRGLASEIPDLSMRQIAATLGRLKKQGLVKSGESRCFMCDGRGRARMWQTIRTPTEDPNGRARSAEEAQDG